MTIVYITSSRKQWEVIYEDDEKGIFPQSTDNKLTIHTVLNTV